MSLRLSPEQGNSIVEFGLFSDNNDSMYTGELTSHKSLEVLDGRWALNLTGVKFGDKSIQESSSAQAIIDSGTRFIYLQN